MTGVLILGIDALDAIMLDRLGTDLPNFTSLKKENPDLRMVSVQPPDSDTAWASIYTGLNPARHGIVRFVDPLEKAHILATEAKNSDHLVGNTFWDVASRHDRQVCVLFPHICFPAWPVKGVMAGRTAKDVCICPPAAVDASHLSGLRLNTISFPRGATGLGRFIDYNRKITMEEARFGCAMLEKCQPGLFFLYSPALDVVQHFLWKYCDEADPSYPGDNPYRGVIREFYRMYDAIVGRFLALASKDMAIMVLSDHGHGMRPFKLVNINYLLKEKGLLFARDTGGLNNAPIMYMEKFKRGLLDFISRHELGHPAQSLMRLFPALRKIYTSPPSIDREKSLACASDLSGIKAYSYAGIIIRKERLNGSDYEDLREGLISDLSELEDEQTGEKITDWAYRREDLYSGPFLDRYPDIVFNFREGYGAGWATNGPLISSSLAHSLVPGSHKANSAVLLLGNLDGRKVAKKNATLMDIAPTILDLLGIYDAEAAASFDGASILEGRHEA